jgi:hypothetical protein
MQRHRNMTQNEEVKPGVASPNKTEFGGIVKLDTSTRNEAATLDMARLDQAA